MRIDLAACVERKGRGSTDAHAQRKNFSGTRVSRRANPLEAIDPESVSECGAPSAGQDSARRSCTRCAPGN
jgi:hypothetical protein